MLDWLLNPGTLFFVGVSTMVLLISYLVRSRNQALWDRLYRGLSEKYELGRTTKRLLVLPTITGRLDGFRLRVMPRGQLNGISVLVDGGQLFALRTLAFSAESQGFLKPQQTDPQVGDRRFDLDVFLRLPDEEIGLALLTEDVRTAVRRFVRAGGRMLGGQLLLEISSQDWVGSEDDLVSKVTRMVEDTRELAELLCDAAADPVAALLTTAQTDRQADVRYGAVVLLAERFGANPAAQEALRTLTRAPDPAVRLEASWRARPQNFEVIRKIARDSSFPAELRARAISRLPTDPSGKLKNIDRTLLSELAETETFAVLTAILKSFLLHDHLPSVELLRRCARRTDQQGEHALVRLISRFGPSEVPWVTDFLQSANPAAAIAAAQALGAMGDGSVVLALTKLSTGRETPTEVKEAARAALERIRSRLGERGGQLSVVGEIDGAVSLTKDREGALSEARARPPKQKA